MFDDTETFKPKGVGNRTVRLDRDTTLKQRIEAVHAILSRDVAGGAKTPEEAQKLLHLAIDPGDAGGRILVA